MNTIKAIRERLQMSQAEMGDGMGCSQGNISLYEKGQTVPPDSAKRLIEFAATHGLTLTFDMVYGLVPLPEPTTDKAGAA